MDGVYRRLGRFYRPFLPYLYVSLALLVITTALALAYPYLLKMIVNDVVLGGQYGKLPWLSLGILVAAFIKGFFNFGQAYLGQLFGSRTAFDLRNALYRKLNHHPFSYYDNIHTGDLMSRMTQDLDAFRMFLAFGINQLVNLALTVVMGILMMLSMNWILALCLAALLPILAVTALRFDKQVHPTFQKIRKTLGQLNSVVQENIMGVRTVKSFAKESFEIDKFNERNDAYFQSNMAATRLWRKFFPFIELVGNLGVVLILMVGGWLVMSHQMNLGDLVAFLSVVWFMIWPMSQLGFLLNNWTQATAAGERLLEILEYPDALDASHEHVTGEIKGRVEFRNVTIRYGDTTVMKNVSFVAEPGETIALLGLTGAGKSSLTSLIARFYDVGEGQILIDGVDVREWDRQNLRRQVGVVFQEPFLFSTTIFANISYGRPFASREDVERAAAMADAAEFIDGLPEGYFTLVGERGMGLSGGQKQRVALARAILLNPSILVLDDATSAVDMETEYEIQQSLMKVMTGRTTFIIAHRISSLKRADTILVLDRGEIVQRGTHEELVHREGLYQRIFNMQFQDFASMTDQPVHTGTDGTSK
ncbi:ABC transporter ATP-binding protein/permease [Alicyclobacillus fastidiosus]|uniref:ABC transporter ATP-binding protein/permease n=1 Tax=Alicyclobacillus fastidiosus TaxID=392011 RepID=A0ABY6ZJX8_9BACL|nr:ABC transporter ATP-binding protein [Alicyclobacillus fastidiosus]WAH43217.1 ABC transporter ATP-binding protein/permease [Alicyclobacillus fastidiosus]